MRGLPQISGVSTKPTEKLSEVSGSRSGFPPWDTFSWAAGCTKSAGTPCAAQLAATVGLDAWLTALQGSVIPVNASALPPNSSSTLGARKPVEAWPRKVIHSAGAQRAPIFQVVSS